MEGNSTESNNNEVPTSKDSNEETKGTTLVDDSTLEHNEITEENKRDEIEIEGNNDEDEDPDLGDISHMAAKERNALFQRALQYEQQKKPNAALKCYLGCLHGLTRNSDFVLLPQCLRNIADIYNDKEDYQRAIQFAQAEKLFYETALIETTDIRKKLDEVAPDWGGMGDRALDLNDLNLDAMRAEEYEHLAKLCQDKNQVELALEYAGKCTKLRQRVYGDNHEKTKDSLNFFASLYAEVGKLQYSDSMALIEDSTAHDSNTLSTGQGDDEVSPEVVMSSSSTKEPVSILRQRSVVTTSDGDSNAKEGDREKKQVRFHESVEESIQSRRREELVSLTVTIVLLLLCLLVLVGLGLWLYCALDRDQSCQNFASRISSWVVDLQYYVHRWTSTPVKRSFAQ